MPDLDGADKAPVWRGYGDDVLISGETMRQVRLQAGMSREALARATGLAYATITRAERGRDVANGKREAGMRRKTLERIAQALKVECGLLIIETAKARITKNGTRKCVVRQRRATRVRNEIIAFLWSYQHANGRPPSLVEIAESIGFRSKSMAFYYVSRLKNEGMVSQLSNSARSIMLTHEGTIKAIALGVVPALLAGRTERKAREHGRNNEHQGQTVRDGGAPGATGARRAHPADGDRVDGDTVRDDR